jgi:hypothetical protein
MIEDSGFNPDLFPPDKVDRAREVYSNWEYKNSPTLVDDILKFISAPEGG